MPQKPEDDIMILRRINEHENAGRHAEAANALLLLIKPGTPSAQEAALRQRIDYHLNCLEHTKAEIIRERFALHAEPHQG